MQRGAAFYITSHSLLSGHQLNNLSAAVATGYAFLPFVLMAGLAIFPLSLAENALLVGILLVAQGLAGYLSWSTLNWPSFAGGLLVVNLDCWSDCASQCQPARLYDYLGTPSDS